MSATSNNQSNREQYLSTIGKATELPFTLLEYRERLDRIRDRMHTEQVDVLYLSAPESICYVSGHQASWYQGQAASDWHAGSGIAIAAAADNYIHFEDEDEVALARLVSVSTDIRIRSHDEDVEEWALFVASELAAQGWLTGTVGLEMSSSRPNRNYSEIFQAALEAKGVRVVDATKLVRGVRNRKSSQELAHIRTAQNIADIGMRAAISHIRPGVTELDVAAEGTYAMAKAGGESAGIPMTVISGPRNSCVHALPSRRVIMAGDIVNIDICGVYNRYHASLARCISMGEPSQAVAAYHKKIAGGVAAVADLIRPMLTASELLESMKAYYEEAGIWHDRWWVGGYELGIAFPPDTVGEFYYEYEREPGQKVFEPGVVCNYESNFYLPESAGLAVSTSTMAFVEEEASFLSGVSPELVTIE
jgi:Xaa-Pro dipeptidase